MKNKGSKYSILRSALMMAAAFIVATAVVVAWFVYTDVNSGLDIKTTGLNDGALSVSAWDYMLNGGGDWADETTDAGGYAVKASLGAIANFNDMAEKDIFFKIGMKVSTDYDYGYLIFIDGIKSYCLDSDGNTLKDDNDQPYLDEDIYYASSGGSGFGYLCSYFISSDDRISPLTVKDESDPERTEDEIFFGHSTPLDRKNFLINKGSGESGVDLAAEGRWLYVKLTPNENILSLLGHIPIEKMPYFLTFDFMISGQARTVAAQEEK